MSAAVVSRTSPAPSAAQLAKLQTLRTNLEALGSAIVAFSGGVDSAFLLAVAHDVLGDQCVALTAVSPSLPERERRSCLEIAEEIGVELILRNTLEIENPDYTSNPSNRCFFCKEALFDVTRDVSEELGIPHVLLGTNTDDLGDYRPGLDSARQNGALSPMADANISKNDVRALARFMGLSVWDKPAMACLSSRFPYGTQITAGRLDRIARCEDLLVELGFQVFRARFHDKVLRIELAQRELQRAFEPSIRRAIVEGCKAEGFLYVTIDLEGYRSGSLNAELDG